jgi:hypothetical protein
MIAEEPGDYDLSVVIGDDAGCEIAKIYTDNVSPAQARADAALIATAPDMRDLLTELMSYWDAGTPVQPGSLLVGEVRELLAKIEEASC